MRKISKKLAAFVAAVATTACLAVSSSAYSVNYAYGSPSYVNHFSDQEQDQASGSDHIEIYSASFYTYISGAWVSATCASHSANSATINYAPTTYYLYYSGTTNPKPGVPVLVNFTLNNYQVSQGVQASGSINA